MADRTILGVGELGRRLALAFVGVAVAAIAVLSALTAASTNHDITVLAGHQEWLLSRAIAAESSAEYQHGGWATADVAPVLDLAVDEGAVAQVRGATGSVIWSTPRFAMLSHGDNPQYRAPVVDRGKAIGMVVVRFGHNGLGAVASTFQAQRWREGLQAAALAVLLALVVALFASRRITDPLERLLSAIRARGAGDRTVRIKDGRAVGVLGELVQGFNRSADALDERDRLERDLVANVAHELRTPVAILQASHEAMLDGVTEPTPENLEALRSEVLRLSRMINDLQRLASAEAAALRLHLAEHDLAAVAAGAAAGLSNAFDAAGVRLVLRLTEVRVLCQPDRMREVVTNLLANALTFTPDGEVLLETGPAGPDLALLRVSDTGIGIAPDDLPRVTERFFRGRASPGIADGSGIGLAIVAELVRAHRGKLDIASEPGHWTQVAVTLPMAPTPTPTPRSVTAARPTSSPGRQVSDSDLTIVESPALSWE
jgi:two-component system sensor histidine kinase BaeS